MLLCDSTYTYVYVYERASNTETQFIQDSGATSENHETLQLHVERL